MKAWLRVPFAVLALLAMFATLLPATVWACPMTGRVNVAARMCAMPAMNGEMPCAKFGGKCCKPLSVPPSQTDDDSGRVHLFTVGHHAPLSLDFPMMSTLDAPVFIVPSLVVWEAPAVRQYLARFANSPPSLRPQHQTTSRSGRAPPVL